MAKLIKSSRIACGILALALLGVFSLHAAPAKAVAPGLLFTQHFVRVTGVQLHYAEAGIGETVLLLPGWPEDWYAWRSVAALLVAQHRRVIVLDPRGFGDSDKPQGGYDLDTAASDVHALIGAVGLRRAGGIDVVSHDLGAWIGYALASGYPGDVRRLVLSEVTLPDPASLRPIADDAANVKTWHFAFNRLPGLPELLVKGHEKAFLFWLFDNKALRPQAIDAAARAEYVRAFSTPGAAHAGFEYYRAMFGADGLKRMDERRAKPLTMPVFTIGARGGVGTLLIDSLKGSAADLHGVVLPRCGHYVPEECATEFTAAVTGFWDASAATPTMPAKTR